MAGGSRPDGDVAEVTQKRQVIGYSDVFPARMLELLRAAPRDHNLDEPIVVSGSQGIAQGVRDRDNAVAVQRDAYDCTLRMCLSSAKVNTSGKRQAGRSEQ
jgi:hypothetical protein